MHAQIIHLPGLKIQLQKQCYELIENQIIYTYSKEVNFESSVLANKSMAKYFIKTQNQNDNKKNPNHHHNNKIVPYKTPHPNYSGLVIQWQS